MSQSAQPLALLLAAFVVVTGACGTEDDEGADGASDEFADEGRRNPEHDAVDHVEDHGLPEPERLPRLPELDEHALADRGDLDDGSLDGDDGLGAEDVVDADDVEEDAEEEAGDDDVPLAAPSNCEKVKVVHTGGATLRIRPDASTAHAPRGSLDPGQIVNVLGVRTGERVNNVTRWYNIREGTVTGYISGAFTQCIDVADPAPAADDDDADEASGFKLPLRCHKTARITQGNNGAYSHNGRSRYAFDFGLPRGTPLVAVADGRVVARRGATRPGDACWSGGGPSCANKANYVVLQHDDGTQTTYAHLNEPSVRLGARVTRGQKVGLSGGTGYSTGPHAHVARQRNCGYTFCQTIEMRFDDVSVHGGVPRTGNSVTSGNCP